VNLIDRHLGKQIAGRREVLTDLQGVNGKKIRPQRRNEGVGQSFKRPCERGGAPVPVSNLVWQEFLTASNADTPRIDVPLRGLHLRKLESDCTVGAARHERTLQEKNGYGDDGFEIGPHAGVLSRNHHNPDLM
jgi:hypothetical protein